MMNSASPKFVRRETIPVGSQPDQEGIPLNVGSPFKKKVAKDPIGNPVIGSLSDSTLIAPSSVGAMFNYLQQARFSYVMLDGYMGLPLTLPKNPMTILVINKEQFALIVRGRWVDAVGELRVTQQRLLQVQDSKGRVISTFRCIEKAEGFLPVDFENQLLGRSVIHNQCVNVPTVQLQAAYALYLATYYGVSIHDSQENAKAMAQFVTEQVGMSPIMENPDVKFGFKSLI